MGKVIRLWSHPRFSIDAHTKVRDILADALDRSRLDRNQFAEALSTALDYPISKGSVDAWIDGEAVPPGDVVAIAIQLAGGDLSTVLADPSSQAMERPRRLVWTPTSDRIERGLTGRQIDLEGVEPIRARTRALWHLDDLVGGDRCIGLADADILLVETLLRNARYSETAERRLYEALAELARFAGWAAFDADQHAAAVEYWTAGLRANAESTDVDHRAFLLSNLALKAIYDGDGQAAVEMLQAERRRVRPIVKAMLDAWQVRALALLGDSKSASHVLHRADAMWDRRAPEDDPDWAYWMIRPSLTAEAGLAFLDLGQPATAERLLSDGLAALDPDSARDRLLYVTGIADAQLDQGREDEALATANVAVDLAANIESSRIHDRIKAFSGRLPRDGPAVREFLDRVRATVQARPR